VLQIINLITTVANTLFNTYLPQFSSYRIKKQYKELKIKFKRALLINYSIIFISFTLVLILGDYILEFLNSNVSLLEPKYLIVIMLYMFLYNNQSVFGTFIATDNKLPHYRAFFISSLLVIGTQFLLMNIFHPTLWNLIL